MAQVGDSLGKTVTQMCSVCRMCIGRKCLQRFHKKTLQCYAGKFAHLQKSPFGKVHILAQIFKRDKPQARVSDMNITQCLPCVQV